MRTLNTEEIKITLVEATSNVISIVNRSTDNSMDLVFVGSRAVLRFALQDIASAVARKVIGRNMLADMLEQIEKVNEVYRNITRNMTKEEKEVFNTNIS